MKPSIQFSRTRSYDYLEYRQFTGVEKIPPPVGTRHGLWSYRWAGIHPKSPYARHEIEVTPNFDKAFSNASHEVRVHLQRLGAPDRRLLYLAQLDLISDSTLASHQQGTHANAVAEQIACAMVIFLLKLRDPGRCPGVLDVPHESQQSGWAIALRETLQGILKTSVPNR